MTSADTKDQTIDRIVRSATEEFARYGIAGARIERIAKRAKTSKERVYAHFRSKEALYRFVAGQELVAMTEAIVLDPADLPDYAGRLFDHAMTHPERHRLMLWGQLEDTEEESAQDDPVRTALQDKTDRIRAAQITGNIDSQWAPEDVLAFVTQLATSWAAQPHLIPVGAERETFLTARRSAVVAAVGRLFPVPEE